MANPFGGAGSGAVAGASVGSVIPGVGTAVGGAIGAGLGALGSIFGGGDETVKRLDVAPAQYREELAQNLISRVGQDYYELVMNRGAGHADVAAALRSNRQLARLFDSYIQSGGMPSANDISVSNQAADGLFAGRRQQLNTMFRNQEVDNMRIAARLGRTADDPVLRAKLLQQQSDIFNQLTADQQSTASNLALGMADRRINFAQGAANTNNALASQALNNRMALIGLGQSIVSAERGFRLNEAGSTVQSTPGWGAAIGGGLAGAGMGFNIGNQLFSSGMPQFGQLGAPTSLGLAPAMQPPAGSTFRLTA